MTYLNHIDCNILWSIKWPKFLSCYIWKFFFLRFKVNQTDRILSSPIRMLNASILSWPLTVRTRIEPSRSVFFSAWKTLSKNIKRSNLSQLKKSNFRNLTRRVRKTQRRHKETLNSTTLRTDHRNFINQKLKPKNISISTQYQITIA